MLTIVIWHLFGGDLSQSEKLSEIKPIFIHEYVKNVQNSISNCSNGNESSKKSKNSNHTVVSRIQRNCRKNLKFSHFLNLVCTFFLSRVTINDIWLVPGQVNVCKEVIPARLAISLVTDTGNTPTHLNKAIINCLQTSCNLTLVGATIAL